MPIDFEKLGAGSPADSVLHPRKIFSVLPMKTSRYQYPRDVQTEVWNEWFDRREEPELVLKMNTGSGKTVVGLVLLKSCLNEKKGPAVYVCPDPFLVKQVIKEAKNLGIEVTDDADDPRFRRGYAILVINIFKLVNGKSVFGIGTQGEKIKIRSLVIDDVHACLSTTVGQFTLSLEATDETYQQIFSLFREDLRNQSEATALQVEQSYTGANMLVPFWAWQKNVSKVIAILDQAKEANPVQFVWPLIKEHIALCHCVFGEGKSEISLQCLPISVIPSFAEAARKIFMTATLTDDSVLVSHFNADPAAVKQAIAPSTASDIGDRMILVPQELNRDAGDDDVKALASRLSIQYNVVVIVPSHYRAGYWSDVAAMTLSSKASNLHKGVARLKKGHVGLVVLVNRYDGIDLPQSACRVLVVDGLPDVRRKIERIEHSVLDGTQQVTSQFIQRIEQGMGRGIRSSEDFCVVILMGHSLIRMLYADDALSMFTPATRAQLELSEKLSKQLRDKPVAELEEVMELCLKRDKNWVSASKGALVHIKSKEEGTVSPLSERLREAFDAAEIRDYQRATDLIQDSVNSTTNKRVRGWLKQQLAEYTNFFNAVESQKILKTALLDNSRLLRPIDGISYTRLMTPKVNQARQCSSYLQNRYGDANKIVLAMNGLLDDLRFVPKAAPRFEEAMNQLGFFYGFRAQRPEKEIGRGPDNLWEIGSLQYLVIEDKNGASSAFINKHDCDQLAGAMNWFESNYNATCKAVPIMVHPSHTFEFASSPHPKTRIIDKEKLQELRESSRTLAKALASKDAFRDPGSVGELLKANGLTAESFVQRYTVKYRTKK